MSTLIQATSPPVLVPPDISLVRAARDPLRTADPTEGRWINGIRYTPEANQPAWVDDVCVSATVDLRPLGAGPTPVLTPSTTGGTLAAGTYAYRIVVVNANGKSLPGPEVTTVTTGATGSVGIAWIPPLSNTPVTYEVYGRTTGAELRIATGLTSPAFTDTGAVTPAGALPVVDTSAGLGYYPPATVLEWYPYVVSWDDRCSLMSWQARDYAGRVRRGVEAATPQAVEREFNAGARTQAAGTGNIYLRHARCVVLSNTAVTFTRALGALEQAIASCGLGGQGMIHLPALATPDFHQIERTGNILRTSRGTIVVPGTGYDGLQPATGGATAPAVTEFWAYATGLVDIRLAEPEVFPDWPANGPVPAEAIDRADNSVVARAKRFALASWDGQCHFGIKVTIPT